MELILRDTLNQLASLPEYRGKILEVRFNIYTYIHTHTYIYVCVFMFVFVFVYIGVGGDGGAWMRRRRTPGLKTAARLNPHTSHAHALPINTIKIQVLVPMVKSVKSVGKQLKLVEQPQYRGNVFILMAMDRDLHDAVLGPNGAIWIWLLVDR